MQQEQEQEKKAKALARYQQLSDPEKAAKEALEKGFQSMLFEFFVEL